MESGPSTDEHFSFNDVLQSYHAKIDEMLGDPLLSDLHQQITLDEVKSMISLEHGQAMTIKVRRGDGEVYPVIVKQTATVSDFKKAIKHYVQLQQERSDGLLHISWKHVWRSHWLVFSGEKLQDDRKPLKDYGIHNRDEVYFIKRLK